MELTLGCLVLGLPSDDDGACASPAAPAAFVVVRAS